MATPSDAPALAAALPDSPAQRRDKILLSSHAPIEEFQKFRDVMRNPASRLDIDITHSGGMAEASANNQVVALCSEVHTRVADFQGALEELSIWKNEFLKQGVSSSVKMSVVLLFSRLFRSNVGLHEPLFELTRIAKIYSQSWKDKIDGLAALEDDHRKQKKALDVAIRKMEHLKAQSDRPKREKTLKNWERLVERYLDLRASNWDRTEQQLIAPQSRRGTIIQIVSPETTSSVPSVSSVENVMPSKEQSHGSQHDVDIRTSAPLVLQTNVGTSAPAINTGKVEKSLLFALGRVVRRHHPTLAEDAENIQHDHWSKVSYLSDVRERFIYSDRTSLTRSFSEMDMRTMNMRRVARKAHYRANSFSMFEDDMTRGHAYLTDDTSLFAEDTADWVPSREIEPTQITDVYDQDYSSDEDSVHSGVVDDFLEQDQAHDHVKKFDELWAANANLKDIDVNNTWFSLKDVMELILLHTQQIHALQTTHEERIQALSQVGREDQEKAEFDAMNVTDRQFDAATSMSNTRQNSKGSWSRNPSANMGRLNGRQSARGSQSRSFSNPGTARVPITIVEGSHNSSGSAYSKGKGAQEPKSFKLSDATLEFFNRLNQFIATKTAKRTKLSTAVRRCETAQTEAKLRSLNQYSRKGSYESEIAKKVFSLNKLDDVRQQQMSQIPVLPPQERRREPLGAFAAHVAAPSESFSEMKMHILNLFRDRKKNIEAYRKRHS